MATTYLDLVNGLNSRVNETQLTSVNFAAATGWYTMAKNAINSALNLIASTDHTWPFFHVSYDETLEAGQTRYAFQTNAKFVDLNTFRVQRNATFNNESRTLKRIDYEKYLRNYSDAEYNTTNTSIRALPRNVFLTPDREFGVYPPPNNAYTLTYEYYLFPTELSAATDLMVYPDIFKELVINVALEYVYLWRLDYESADRIKRHYTGLQKDLRRMFMDRPDSVHSTMITESGYKYANSIEII